MPFSSSCKTISIIYLFAKPKIQIKVFHYKKKRFGNQQWYKWDYSWKCSTWSENKSLLACFLLEKAQIFSPKTEAIFHWEEDMFLWCVEEEERIISLISPSTVFCTMYLNFCYLINFDDTYLWRKLNNMWLNTFSIILSPLYNRSMEIMQTEDKIKGLKDKDSPLRLPANCDRF